MQFVLLFGPQAVGKMTIGKALATKTHLKLFHNHMTIDLLVPLFGFTEQMWTLCHTIRNEIFAAAAKSNLDGLIFTTVWAFNQAEEWQRIDEVCRCFRSAGADMLFIELEADLNVRLKRNLMPDRLAEKPTKRDIKQSEQNLIESMQHDRLNSFPGEITEANYLRINTTDLSADQAAELIKTTFHLA